MRFVIGFFIAVSLAFPLSAQDTGTGMMDPAMPSAGEQHRNPRRALVLGTLIPGAGHIYAGEYLRGFLIYEGTVAAIGMGVMVYILDNCTFAFTEPCESGPEWPHRALGIAAVGVGIWNWISSARDAPRAAERANERRRRRSLTVTPIIDAFSGTSKASHVGVSVHW